MLITLGLILGLIGAGVSAAGGLVSAKENREAMNKKVAEEVAKQIAEKQQ